MADVNANIGVHIDTSAALAELKALQRQLATFHSSVARNSAAATQAQKGLQTNLLNSINATGKFHAQMGLVRSSTDSFTHALEKNKLSMREYFRYAGGSTRTFGKLFKQEFSTIGKVAEERVKKMQTQYIKMGRDASGAIKSMSITPRTLDMTNYANKTAVAAQKQAILNQLLKQGSTNLLNFGKNTQWAGRQLMVGFTVPLAYFGTMAAKTFMDLEKQAIRFKRVYGDMFTTSDQTNKALADVQKLAEEFTKYGVAVSKTMEMAASAAAMGKTGADLTAQVAQATRLAVLGGVEQEQALETTISVTNAFGIAAEDLAKKIDFLNAVENQTVVSIEDLTIAIPKAGPVVKQLGGSVEDLAFFLTAMKEGGINASEGANALKSGLASLINPTEKASKMLASMGINIKAIVEGNQGNIRETVVDFAQALDTLDPLNRARAIEQLFGKFQFSRLSTLFQNVTKDGTQAARVLNLATASVEELAIMSERELGVLEDAIGTDFKESIEKLKLAIAPIGKEFLKAITPVAKAIGSFLEKFNNLGDGTKKFIVIATTLVGVIGPVLLMTFGLLMNAVANIVKLFTTMRSGFLKTGANTNLLAQQTSYLNSEQLEAATVAASLNQSHTRLTQSFNMEATAVRLLRQAYIDATIAATNFARANPGMMMPGKGAAVGKVPKKFASGVTKVPGRGNKDTVPSMLTPGEAVIPAPVAQDPRFQPIIDAMVNGKIAQYNGGTTNAGGGAALVAGLRAAQQRKYNKQDAALLEGISLIGSKRSTTSTRSGLTNNSLTNNLTADKSKAIKQRFKKLYSKDPQTKQSYRRNAENLNKLVDRLVYDPTTKTYSFTTNKGKVYTKISEKKIFEKANYVFGKTTSQQGQFINDKKFGTPANLEKQLIRASTEGMKSGGAPREVRKLREEYNKKNAGAGLNREKLLLNQQLTKQGLTSTEIKKFMGKASENHINKPLDPKTKWQSGLSIYDYEGVGQYLNRAGKKSVGKLINDSVLLKELGYTDRDISKLKQSYAFAQKERQPTNAKQLGHLARIADLEVKAHNSGKVNIPNIYQAKGILGVSAVRTPEIWKDLSRSIMKLGDKPSFVNKKAYAVMQNKEGFIDTKGNFVPFDSKNTRPRSSSTPTKNSSLDKRVANLDKSQAASVRKIGKFGPMPKIAGLSDAPKIDARTSPGKAVSEIEKNTRATNNSIRRNMEKVQREQHAMLKEQNKLMAEQIKLQKEGVPLTAKEQKMKAKEIRSQKIGRVAGPTAGLAGMASMGAFMTGNNSLGMGLMGVSAIASIAPMLANPLGIAVAAAATLAGGFFLLNKRMDDATKKQVAYVDSVTAGTKKMQKVGELTGKVGASQIAQKQRETGARTNEFRTGYDREDNQFGTNFLASDIGKEIFKGFNDTVAKDGPKAAQLLATQLSAYISDGVMSAEQANSVARAIGINLGDMSITSQINGRLRELVGPDGQDLLKDPLSVRLNIISSQAEMSNELKKVISEFESVKGGEDGFDYRGYVAQAAVANAKNLEIIQAQRNAQYQTNQAIIDNLKKQQATTTDKEKQLQLENQIIAAKAKQKSEDQVLAEKSKQIIKDAEDLYNLARENAGGNSAQMASGAYIDALQAGIKSANKDNPFLDAFIGKSADLQTVQLEAQINTAVLGGQLGIPTALKLMEMFAGTEEGEAKLKAVLETTVATQDPGVFQSFMDIVSGKNIDSKIKMEILTDQEKFEDRVNVLNRLKDLDGDAINLEVLVNNLKTEGLDKLVESYRKIENIKGPITLKTINEIKTITGDEELNMSGLVDIWSKYENSTDEIKKTVIQEYIAIYKSITPEEVEDLINNELAAGGGSPDRMDERRKVLEAKYYTTTGTGKEKEKVPNLAAAAGALVSQRGAKAPNVIPGGGLDDEGGGGSRDTTFDDILINLKRTRDATINAQGGAQELIRILGGAKDLQAFNGIDQQLSKIGANSDFIDFVGGLEKAIQNKIINVSKKGVVSLTELGKATKKAYDEKQLGLFSAANAQVINESIKQRDAFVQLKAAGVETADAQEMLADAIFMTSLAAQKNPEEIKKMIAEYKNMRLEVQKTLEETNPEKAFDVEMSKAMDYYDFLEKQAKAAAKPEIDRITDLIDANDKLIENQQRNLEMNFDRPIEKYNQNLAIIDKAAEGINNKYDAQQAALEKISTINQEIAEQEKGRLTLADALTSGDISAAAAAAQQLRQDAAANAIQRSSGALQIARESEIAGLTSGGLTRAQIEKEIYSLEQKRLPIIAEITGLQDKNYNLQVKELQPLQESLDAKIKNIDASKTAFTNQQLAIQAAGFEADKTNAKFKLGEGIVAAVKKLWDDIKDKNITVTATYATAGAPPAPPTKPTTSFEDLTKEFISRGIAPGPAAGLAASSARYQAQADAYFKAQGKMYGGKILPMAMGGLVPKYMVNGGGIGSDTVPAMLTPGEFVMNKRATDQFGPMLSMLNESKYPSMIGPSYASQGESGSNITSISDNSSNVYNYSVGITVPQSNANPNDIARAVIGQIKYIDNQRIRGQK
jgi:TP901 family phage tail tape measure protein